MVLPRDRTKKASPPFRTKGSDSEALSDFKIGLLRWRSGRRRGHFRHRLTAMAGVTANVGLPVGELGVDVVYHLNHLAGHELLGILVARIVALHVAEVALHAERTTHSAHHRAHLILFEDFEILVRLRS